MIFIDLVAKRFSIRRYKDKPVEQEKLDYILRAAALAPSAVNFQPLRFYVVRTAEMLHNIQKCYPRPWFTGFHTCIVVCGDHSQGWHRADGKDHTDIDVAIATDHLTLAATEQGLGTCWVCNFDVERCTEVLGLPSHIEPVVLVPIGYEADGAEHEKKRKRLEELVQYV